MNNICKDIIVLICGYLTDKNKINLLTSNKKFILFKEHIVLTSTITLDGKIMRLSYFDSISCLKINNAEDFIKINDKGWPKNIRILIFGDKFNYDIKNKIPLTVERLTFGRNFDQDVYKYLPPSVQHLSVSTFKRININNIPLTVNHLTFSDRHWDWYGRLGVEISKSITHLILGACSYRFKNNLSYCLTHLAFGHCFNNNIQNLIPLTVTHLTFGSEFDQNIYDMIPSVTHLTLGRCFNQDLKTISSIVTHLTLNLNNNKNIYDTVPKTVTHLIIVVCHNMFGQSFEETVKKYQHAIPSTVTHLSFAEFKVKNFKGFDPSTLVKILKR